MREETLARRTLGCLLTFLLAGCATTAPHPGTPIQFLERSFRRVTSRFDRDDRVSRCFANT